MVSSFNSIVANQCIENTPQNQKLNKPDKLVFGKAKSYFNYKKSGLKEQAKQGPKKVLGDSTTHLTSKKSTKSNDSFHYRF